MAWYDTSDTSTSYAPYLVVHYPPERDVPPAPSPRLLSRGRPALPAPQRTSARSAPPHVRAWAPRPVRAQHR